MRDIDWIGDAARHFVALDAADDDDRGDPWAPACRLCGGPHLWPACPRLDECPATPEPTPGGQP